MIAADVVEVDVVEVDVVAANNAKKKLLKILFQKNKIFNLKIIYVKKMSKM